MVGFDTRDKKGAGSRDPRETTRDGEEVAECEVHSMRIYASRKTLGACSQWTSASNTVFDGTCRRLAGAAKAEPRK